MPDPWCADISDDHAEPLWATASLVHGWLLVEQPGAWGIDAPLESRLPSRLARTLLDRGQSAGVRVILVRRPDRPRAGPRHCFAVHSGRADPWVEHRVVTHPEELLDLDLRAVGMGERPGFGRPWTDPLYVVCTNGRHDPCCARLGRPVVRALAPERRNAVWECSHIGGDRFAGNLVCLPDGLYFGRLAPADAPRVVAGYEGGLIDLEHYRGRAGDPFLVQAAEYFLRRELGLLRIDEVAPMGRRRVAPGVTEVRFTAPRDEEFDVRVRVTADAAARRLTCRSTVERRPVGYELDGVFPRGTPGPAVH